MQKMATDILGMDYTEIRPKIKSNPSTVKKKQIAIGIHGTAQSKYWNNPNGWQDVVDWLKGKGYEVKLISREGDGYMGNKHPMGISKLPAGSIEGVIDELKSSEMFIGIGSGLSWLSWGLGVKTVLISGFSYDWAEMRDCIRISPPKGKCEGCFNRLRLDAGDWNWCPDHKGTERQFECTKSITSEMVIKELEKIL
jgi:autotransporter strand-loop-strand O-heptosyltransferase